MGLASDMRDTITLERLNDAAEPKVWDVVVANLPAAAESQGDGRYRFRIRYRSDLRTKADVEPAMRVLYGGDYYDLEEPVEAVRRVETHLFAKGRITEDIPDLASGARRVKAWP